jgi:probable rRNA maturation factor
VSEVEVLWEVDARPLDDEAVRTAVRAALAHGGRAGAGISVLLTDDPTLAELHERFLGDPSPTDVMSFDLGEEEDGPAGEVVVSVDRAREVAERRGVEHARELALYLVHGVLHLCGFDDHEDGERARMREAEATVLRALGYAPDKLPHEE